MISSSPSSRDQRKAGESNPKPGFPGNCLAGSFLSQFGYLPSQWTGRGVEPRSPGCRPGIFPLDEPPMFSTEVRSGVEPELRPYQGRVLPQHLQTDSFSVIPDGIEPSLSWMSARCLRRWTTGSTSTVTEVGVEPTDTRLSTSLLCLFAYPAMRKLQILESNQASNLMRVG